MGLLRGTLYPSPNTSLQGELWNRVGVSLCSDPSKPRNVEMFLIFSWGWDCWEPKAAGSVLKWALSCVPSRLKILVVYVDSERVKAYCSQDTEGTGGRVGKWKSKGQSMGKMMGFCRVWGTLTTGLLRGLVEIPQVHTLTDAADLVLWQSFIA